MLAVRQMREDGRETVFLAQEVVYVPTGGAGDGRAELVCTVDGAPIHLKDGVIYVMNAAGKTVAKYDLRRAAAIGANRA